MKKIELKGKKRSALKKHVKKLRRENIIPAVIYGPSFKSANVVVNLKEFKDVLKDAEETKIIDFVIEGEEKPVKVLIREVQLPPLGGDPIHVSFLAIDMNKKIVVSIPVEIVGESEAVKNNIGIMVNPVAELPIRSLPGDIPEIFNIDISVLKDIGDTIKISDIKLPENVEWESNLVTTNNVAYIIAPQKEEEYEASLADEVKEGEEEVEGAETEEGAEGVEGAEGEAPKEGEEGAKGGEGKPGAPEKKESGEGEKK